MDWGTIVGVAVTLLIAGVGGVVWLVRLEGRLNLCDSRQASADKRIDGIEERIMAQLDRIENRLTAMANK